MILIFGGTTEGRLAAETCDEAGKTFWYSTKSGIQDVEMHNGVRLCGAMATNDIITFCEKNKVRCIINAAHPFAENLHHTIEATGIPVIRLQRNFGKHIPNVTYCKDYDEAMKKMERDGVRHLMALSGVNTIAKMKPYWTFHKTTFRILNRAESIETALKQQFPTSNLIFYNDDNTLPDKQQEKTLFESIGCDAIITKESGNNGGFTEKVDAALELGMKVFVVEHPTLPLHWTYVSGKHGLRRAVEQSVPDFFPLKTGFTTGACATAATKAALTALLTGDTPEEIDFTLPDEEVMHIPIDSYYMNGNSASASVTKDFSDDPDVTKGCKIISTVLFNDNNTLSSVRFMPGKGVGTVTLPGLGIAVGEPAINPTPRLMIENETRLLTDRSIDVSISVENGEEIAKKTFNPRVGVIGGISIIGTSGIVHPLSNKAFIQSIRREMEVAKAIGCNEVALVSGMKSENSIKNTSCMRCIHYGNFVGDSLRAAQELEFNKVILAIMIGKAVKLAEGHLDTHSHKVTMNKDFLKSIAPDYTKEIESICLARELWNVMPQSFFNRITELCMSHCKPCFPNGELEIRLIKD